VEQSKELHAFMIPASWETALNNAARPGETSICGTYIVKGPKNSGKSTFARTLMNRLLELYVDFVMLFLFDLTWFKLSTRSFS